MRRFVDYLSLVWFYLRLNLRAQLEYRGAFVSQVVAMFVNDAVWVIFWALFFTRFPVLHGWQVRDVITLWAIAAAGFGLAHAVFGNGLSLATLISDGQLDPWMLYPRALLPHILLGRMTATAWGDALFGFAVYIAFVRPDVAHLALFTALALSTAVLFVGFSVLTASLALYLGESATLTDQWRNAMITFATYPGALFHGAVKLLLFTVLPAAFVNTFPVQALRSLSLADAGLAFAGALAVLVAGTTAFYRGLRRYQSGNLIAMRE